VSRLLSGPQLSGQLFGEGRLGVRSGVNDRTLAAVRLGPVGKCPDAPVLLITTVDNSGSVVGTGGNDPCGNRFQEMRLAIETVAKRCKCGNELVAMLNFDSPNSADVAPTSLRDGIGSLGRGLAIPQHSAGSSVLGPSLAQARHIADRHPNHRVVFVVLSDFQLFDSDVAGVLSEFTDFPGKPHAVVLRSAVPAALVEDPRVIVSPVNSTDPAGTLAKAIFTALTATRRIPSRKR
jgi:hypothetical protein